MKQTLRMFYGDEVADTFKASRNWLHRFTKRIYIANRRKTNKKKIGNSERLPIIQAFHRQLRKDVQSKRRRHGGHFDEKWSRCLPSRRYNVDQLPCPVDQVPCPVDQVP